MGYIVRMPSLGMQMDQGEVIAWHVEEGDEVEEEAVIAEIESEKASAEIEATETGVIRHIIVEEGGRTEPGKPMGIIAAADEDISDLIEEVEQTGVSTDGTDESTATDSGEDEPTAETEEPAAAENDTDRVKASPRAKRRAEALGVDLETIEGSAPNGAITVDDVEATAGTTTKAAEAEADSDRMLVTPRAQKRAEELRVDLESIEGSAPNGGIIERDVEEAIATQEQTLVLREEREPSGMRRTIANRLGESYREAIHVTETRAIDVETLFAATEAADKALDADVSISDVLLVTVSDTLAEHPEFNAHFEDGVHRLYEQHNIATAIDVEDGLVTPVIRDVGSKPLPDLAAERRAITDRTLAGDYTMDDLTDGTFTISNLGVLGIDAFTPIINPPQVAILGIGRAYPRPLPTDDGGIEFRRHMTFSLSFDHRVVDGADAARFLATLAERLENAWSAVIR